MRHGGHGLQRPVLGGFVTHRVLHPVHGRVQMVAAGQQG
jgi:hypothetical protein